MAASVRMRPVDFHHVPLDPPRASSDPSTTSSGPNYQTTSLTDVPGGPESLCGQWPRAIARSIGSPCSSSGRDGCPQPSAAGHVRTMASAAAYSIDSPCSSSGQGWLSSAVRREACGYETIARAVMRFASTHHAPWRSSARHSLDVSPPPSQGPAESVRRRACADNGQCCRAFH